MTQNTTISTILSSLYNLNAKLDEKAFLQKIVLTVLEITCPPYFGSQDKDVQPSSINFL